MKEGGKDESSFSSQQKLTFYESNKPATKDTERGDNLSLKAGSVTKPGAEYSWSDFPGHL